MEQLEVTRSQEIIKICNVQYNFKQGFWRSLNTLIECQCSILARDSNATILHKERRGGSLVRDTFGKKH